MADGERKDALWTVVAALLGTAFVGALFLFGETRVFEAGGWGWLIVSLVSLGLFAWILRSRGWLPNWKWRRRRRRRVCQKTAPELAEAREGTEGMTDIQKEQRVARFKGQLLPVSGVVEDVSRAWPWGWTVTLKPDGSGSDDGDGRSIEVDLRFVRRSSVAGLAKAERLTCIGRIDDISPYTVYLKDCDL